MEASLIGDSCALARVSLSSLKRDTLVKLACNFVITQQHLGEQCFASRSTGHKAVVI